MAWKLPMIEHVDVSKRPGWSERQKRNVKHWTDMLDRLNVPDWDGMDRFFDTKTFRYGNPNRPDIGTYEEWKSSPKGLYNCFAPAVYKTIEAAANGEDEIWIHATHYCKHDGGPYMGVKATGNEFQVYWFSIIRFNPEGKITNIYSISDVLTMLTDIGVIPERQPIDPYR